MNSFLKKSLISLAAASVLTTGAVADTTWSTTNSTGVNVSAGANKSLTALSTIMTETLTGTIAADTVVTFALDNGTFQDVTLTAQGDEVAIPDDYNTTVTVAEDTDTDSTATQTVKLYNVSTGTISSISFDMTDGNLATAEGASLLSAINTAITSAASHGASNDIVTLDPTKAVFFGANVTAAADLAALTYSLPIKNIVTVTEDTGTDSIVTQTVKLIDVINNTEKSITFDMTTGNAVATEATSLVTAINTAVPKAATSAAGVVTLNPAKAYFHTVTTVAAGADLAGLAYSGTQGVFSTSTGIKTIVTTAENTTAAPSGAIKLSAIKIDTTGVAADTVINLSASGTNVSTDALKVATVVAPTVAVGTRTPKDTLGVTATGVELENADIPLTENVIGAMEDGAKIVLTLPSTVSFVDTASKNIINVGASGATATDKDGDTAGTNGEISGTNNEILTYIIEAASTSTQAITLEDLVITTASSNVGDLNVTLKVINTDSSSGSAVETEIFNDTVKLAEIVNSGVKVSVADNDTSTVDVIDVPKMSIGRTAMTVKDITIAASLENAIDTADTTTVANKTINISLPSGVTINTAPTILTETTFGDTTFNEASNLLTTVANVGDSIITLSLDSAKTIEAIKLSGLKVSLSNDVAAGDLAMTIAGSIFDVDGYVAPSSAISFGTAVATSINVNENTAELALVGGVNETYGTQAADVKANLQIVENEIASLNGGLKTIVLTTPTGCTFNGVPDVAVKAGTGTGLTFTNSKNSEVSTDKTTATFYVNTTSTKEATLTFDDDANNNYIVLDCSNVTTPQALTMNVAGTAGIASTDVEVATLSYATDTVTVAPIPELTKDEVNQVLAEVKITELIDQIKDDSAGEIKFLLPSGVSFAGVGHTVDFGTNTAHSTDGVTVETVDTTSKEYQIETTFGTNDTLIMTVEDTTASKKDDYKFKFKANIAGSAADGALILKVRNPETGEFSNATIGSAGIKPADLTVGYIGTIPTMVAATDADVKAGETATVVPTEATGTVTYTSSDEAVATVDAAGTVTVVAEAAEDATVTITATDSLTAQEVTTVVTVAAAEPVATMVAAAAVSVKAGETATVVPTDSTGTVTYVSSDETVATVDAAGLVTVLADAAEAATVTITATDATTSQEVTTVVTVAAADVVEPEPEEPTAIELVEEAIIANGSAAVDGSFAYYEFSEDAPSNWTYTTAAGATYQLNPSNGTASSPFGWTATDVTPNDSQFDFIHYGAGAFDWVLFTADCGSVYKLAETAPGESFSYDVDGDGDTDALNLTCSTTDGQVTFTDRKSVV